MVLVTAETFDPQLLSIQQDVLALNADFPEAHAVFQQAQEASRRIRAETEARIAAKEQEMLRGVRQEGAQLAVLAASQVAGKNLDRETDRAMVEEFLSEAGDRA